MNETDSSKIFSIREMLFSFGGDDSQRIILTLYIPDLIVLVWTKNWKLAIDLLKRIEREINYE